MNRNERNEALDSLESGLELDGGSRNPRGTIARAQLAALRDLRTLGTRTVGREYYDQAIRERDSARQEVVAANGLDYWTWQGDGGDHLESMGEGMVIKMTAGNLRAMLIAGEWNDENQRDLESLAAKLHKAGMTADNVEEVLDDAVILPPTPPEGDGEESLESQVQRLANFIMAEVPGEPSQSEGAIDTAIRLLRMVLNK